MTRYLLIESRDPYDHRGVERDLELAAGLVAEGHQVTLYLVQNGVLPARRTAERPAALAAALGGGVEVLADDFSLRERGIDAAELADGLRPASLDLVVDRLAAGDRTLWL